MHIDSITQPFHVGLRLGSLIEAIRVYNKNAYIIVSGIIPVVNRDYWCNGIEVIVRAINNVFPIVCANYDRVVFAATQRRFLRSGHARIDCNSEDGLHLSELGVNTLSIWFGQLLSDTEISQSLHSKSRANLRDKRINLIKYDWVTVFKSPVLDSVKLIL